MIDLINQPYTTKESLITFSYPCKVKKVLFFDQIFEMEILMNLHVMRAPKFENHIF